MKIAQIVCAYPPYAGGIGIGAERFARLISEGGKNQVTTFTLAPLKQDGALSEPDNTVYLSPRLRRGHGGLPFSLLKKLDGFDCLYLHYPFFGGAEITWLYKKLHKKTRLVISYHMDTDQLSGINRLLAWPSRLVRNSLFGSADTIIVSSLDYIKSSSIAKLYKRHPKRFKEIPFGLDTERFCLFHKEKKAGLAGKAEEIMDFITKSFIKRDRANILFVGGLDSAHYFKGLPVLLDALAGLAEKNWRLSIIGSGNLLPQYRAQAEALGIGKKVTFLGKVPETSLIRQYQEADIFVLPSINRHEAFGLVLTEAMACGCAVIASDLPGVRTVFRDGLDGLLAVPNDASDLGDKLSMLVRDEKKRQAMGVSARSYAVGRYSLPEIKAKLDEVFR